MRRARSWEEVKRSRARWARAWAILPYALAAAVLVADFYVLIVRRFL